MLETIACPHCGASAELTQRFWLDATDGPIQHLKTICLSKHWLTARAETVHQQGPAARSQPRHAGELLGPGAAGGARQHHG